MSDRAQCFAFWGILWLLMSGATGHAAADSEAPEQLPNLNLAEGLEISLWASSPMLGSPVAIAVDRQGRVYVTQTVRRRHSALPIRAHPDWKANDLSFNSVEDRRAFIRRQLAPWRSDENHWLPDRNNDGTRDWHDLMVQSDKIYQLLDTDGDGKADRSTVLAEDFNTEVTGVAAGVLPYQGSVYATIVPDLWQLQDTDSDGKADRRRSLAYGFGVHMGYSGHNMHGLTVGPDGKLYWSIGDIGSNVTTPDGRLFKNPHEGAVFRCNPDGSDFEVFATGLRNPQEIAFDQHGNLFTVDNDSDKAKDDERIVYIAQGSDSGWRIHWQYEGSEYNPWLEERLYSPRFPEQAAYVTPPVAHYSDGPAGFKYNPGTALNATFRDHFFIAEFTGSASQGKVTAFTLSQKGAGFQLEEQRSLVQGVLTTGLAFGPGGALYLADWIRGWVPHDEGRVWKIDAPNVARSATRTQTKRLLQTKFDDEWTTQAIARHLQHPDMRVRQKAQFELVTRGKPGSAALLKAARQENHPLARLHGIWGIGQLAENDPALAEPLIELLTDSGAEVRAQAAKVLGEAEYRPARSPLLALLDDPSPRARHFAAIALGALNAGQAFKPLVSMLAANDGKDPWLRHAGVMGLLGAGTPEEIAALADHPSMAVRRAAIVALRRLNSPAIRQFLSDRNELVLVEAARAIHDDSSIPQALPALADLSNRPDLKSEPLLRRVINAHLRLGDLSNATALADYAGRSGAPESMRTEAMLSLAAWPNPPVLDRVEGCYRYLGKRGTEIPREALARVAEGILADAPDSVRIATAKATASVDHGAATGSLHALVIDDQEPADVRVAALEALGQLDAPELAEAVEVAVAADSSRLRQTARSVLASVNASDSAAIDLLETALAYGTIDERQAAFETLGQIGSDRAIALLDDWLDRLLAGELPPAIRLDLLQAAEATGSKQLRRKVEQYHDSKPNDDPLAPWSEAIAGGDPDQGKKIVFNDITAQCIRCHTVEGEGGNVAPELSQIGSREPEYLLESLVRPNATIAEGYRSILLTLDETETVSGTLAQENDKHLVIQNALGEKQKIEKSRIRKRMQSDVSAMPPMGAILTKEEIRDVIAYLRTLQ